MAKHSDPGRDLWISAIAWAALLIGAPIVSDLVYHLSQLSAPVVHEDPVLDRVLRENMQHDPVMKRWMPTASTAVPRS